MNRFSRSLTLALAIAASLTAAAQSRVVLKANVPFAFSAHERTFAPGAYSVREIGANLLRLENGKGEGVTVLVVGQSPSDQPKLVFHRYAEKIFLAEIDGPLSGGIVDRSAGERAAQRQSRPRGHLVVALKK
ncbi:MAG TPA: hypothetical protein VFU76_12550 [Terriglobales bacterium]|nr:hypothetical protein [Terriglobales bacterium]